MALPFPLIRPLLLAEGLRTDRDRPALRRLAEEPDPWRFVWGMLPHAARSFAPCILVLPAPMARASALAYLYCRIIDCYEDLLPDEAESCEALERFAARFERSPLPPPPPLRAPSVRDGHDEAHALLVDRCALVDAALGELPRAHQALIAELVAEMAAGMAKGRRAFARGGGTLETRAQLEDYSDAVLGACVRFGLKLLRAEQGRDTTLPEDLVADTRAAGILLQLANVLRDIEKDLARGVAYVPELRPDLAGQRPGRSQRLDAARARLLRLAVRQAPAYARVVRAAGFRPVSLGRASTLLALGFCWRHFTRVAEGLNRPPVGPLVQPPTRRQVFARALRGGGSVRFAERELEAAVAALVALAE